MERNVKLVFFFFCINYYVLTSDNEEMQDINELAARNLHNINLRPFFAEKPVEIDIEIVISTLGPIKEKDMTFELSFYLRQWWHDPRLKYNGTLEEITSNISPKGKIWIPDIYIVNVRDVTYYTDFTRTVVKRDGSVYFSEKVSAKCTCHMDLTKYPFDAQVCGAQFESFAFNVKDLRLRWYPASVDKVPDKEKLSLSGYMVTNVTRSSRNVSFGPGESNLFENVFLHLHVTRTSVYYFYKAFAPTIFLTILNLGSYWIPDTAMPARVTLIITTFLANMFILQSVSEQTVKVSYTTAMQLFLLVNIIFLMTSIVQYLILLTMKNKIRFGTKKSTVTPVKQWNYSYRNGNGELTNKQHFMEKKESFPAKNDVHILDRIFRYLIPICYVIFCTVYFVVYLI